MKATTLIEELEKLIKEQVTDTDVQTFSGQLGVYKESDEIKRIWIEG